MAKAEPPPNAPSIDDYLGIWEGLQKADRERRDNDIKTYGRVLLTTKVFLASSEAIVNMLREEKERERKDRQVSRLVD